MSNKVIKDRQQNSNDIIIDDGSRVYNIRNKRGEKLGEFAFIPSDTTGIMERYEHAVNTFDSLQERANSEKDTADVRKLTSEYEEEIKKEIDYLFDANVSGAFFAVTSPFTPLETGEFFVENVLNAVRGIIEKETNRRLSKVKNRASKYTQKYHR